MFWKYNSQGTSQIDALLDKADVGLNEVLEQEEVNFVRFRRIRPVT